MISKYAMLNPNRPRIGRLLASAVTAAIIAGGGAALAAMADGVALGRNGLIAAIITALIAGAKDYRTYSARPPVHGAQRRL